MEYRRMDRTILLRLARGEEIHPALEELCRRERIKAGLVSGIGAVDRAELGAYRVSEKRYHPIKVEEEGEIASLTGNISTMNEACYLHLHAVIGLVDGRTVSGHLTSGRISATAEIVIQIFDATLDRRRDEDIGINLWKLQ